jgi:hypothetical protein
MMGSKLAHENEAPFPESLARSAVMSLCPPGGIVYDPFGGSGTTAAAAIMARRSFVVTDIREEQCDLTLKRIEEAHDRLLTDLPYDEICANCVFYRGSHVPNGTTWWGGRCLYCGEEAGVTGIRDMERNNETVQI